MVCFDYEEVKCVICDEKFMDGYTIHKDKVVCDGCLDALNNKIKGE